MKAIGWTKRLTPFDCKLLIVVAVLVFLSFLLPLSQTAGARVVVSSDDQIVLVAPLAKAQRVKLDGSL